MDSTKQMKVNLFERNQKTKISFPFFFLKTYSVQVDCLPPQTHILHITTQQPKNTSSFFLFLLHTKRFNFPSSSSSLSNEILQILVQFQALIADPSPVSLKLQRHITFQRLLHHNFVFYKWTYQRIGSWPRWNTYNSTRRIFVEIFGIWWSSSLLT